jgi:hypothetical protein
MEELEKFWEEEVNRIEDELKTKGKSTLITYSYDDLRPLAINIVTGLRELWSESIPFSIREGIDIIDGKAYITIVGEQPGKQFAVSKKLELD